MSAARWAELFESNPVFAAHLSAVLPLFGIVERRMRPDGR
jgi:hypothetical protein